MKAYSVSCIVRISLSEFIFQATDERISYLYRNNSIALLVQFHSDEADRPTSLTDHLFARVTC